MVIILVIGIAVDSLVFGTLDRAIRRRWGLMDPAGG
jgi:NitT/TauT family transport system permease protein